MIPWKVLWVVTGVMVTTLAGGVPVLLGVAPYWTIPIAVIASLLVLRVVDDFVHTCDLFRERKYTQKQAITKWIRVGVLAHLLWISTLQVLPGSGAVFAAVLMGLSTAEYLFAEMYEYRTARTDRAEVAAPVGPDGQPLDLIGQNFMYALESVGRGRAELMTYEHITEEGPAE